MSCVFRAFGHQWQVTVLSRVPAGFRVTKVIRDPHMWAVPWSHYRVLVYITHGL